MSSKPARFWPIATIIILPVLVLAGVAALFLARERTGVRMSATMLAKAQTKRIAWYWENHGFTGNSQAVVKLYEAEPVPGPSGPGEEEWKRALAARDMSALRQLRDSPAHAGMTASGLPIRVLAAWELFSQSAEGTNPARLAQTAIFEEPSAISARIVEELKSSVPSAAASWAYTERQRLELREVLRRNVLPAVPSAGKSGAEENGTPEFSLVLVRSVAPAPGSSGLTLIVRHSNGGIQVEPDTDRPGRVVRELFTGGWEKLVRGVQFEIRELGAKIAGDENGVLAVEVRDGCVIVGRLVDEVALFAGYRRLVWWCSGIIGGALVTALLGLWLVRRSLNKERRLGELKSQFVSSVSHELRAPIGSMRLMAEGLASGRVQGAAAGEFHRLMAGEGARLSSLIENVLDFARIEQGRKEYVMAETDVAALLQESVALMQPQAEAKGLRILLECEPLPFVPRVDAGAVQQAVINLLDNAVKFTAGMGNRDGVDGIDRMDCGTEPELVVVRVRLAGNAAGWSITVADPGPGIPEAEHARIFERFYRLGNELRRETTGTGIGLAIVKHIVEGHGGRVRVSSEPGRGSEFSMMFPTEK